MQAGQMQRRQLLSLLAVATPALATEPAPLQLTDLAGTPQSFPLADAPLTLLWFFSCNCPIARDYLDRVDALTKKFTEVRFLLANPNANEPSSQTRDFATTVKMPVPLYIDTRNQMADRFHATLTPEAFLLNNRGEILYQGAIDDHRNPARVKVKSLELALQAASKHKKPPYASWKSFGCTIKRSKTSA